MTDALEIFLKSLGPWAVAFVILGSLVDLAQAVWITRRGFRKLKRVVYNKIREEIRADYARKGR